VNSLSPNEVHHASVKDNFVQLQTSDYKKNPVLNVKAQIGQNDNAGVWCMSQFENYGHFTAPILKALEPTQFWSTAAILTGCLFGLSHSLCKPEFA